MYDIFARRKHQIPPQRENLHAHPYSAGDLTIYQITLFVNLSAKTMVKFRPFLRHHIGKKRTPTPADSEASRLAIVMKEQRYG
jgi:hypothetical protein